jgi:hypothetical protein
MNLTGSRPTLIANVCALIVASVVVVEGQYIVHEVLRYYSPQDIWGFFFPALVMFIIRSRNFSFCFLALYVLLSIQMLFQARSIYFGTYVNADPKSGPLSYLPLFFLASAACLLMYAGGALVCSLTRLMVREPPAPIGDDPPDWKPR